MRYLCLFALALILSACAQGPGLAPMAPPNCDEGVCVNLQAAGPLALGQTTPFLITVTSEKDVHDAAMTLDYDGAFMGVEGPAGWEPNAREGWADKFGGGWKFDVKANQPVRFTRVVRMPPAATSFQVYARLSLPPRSYNAMDIVYVIFTGQGGAAYGRGTPLPITPYVTFTPWPPQRNAQGTILPTITLLPTPTFGLPPTRDRRTQTPTVIVIPTPMSSPYP